MWIGPRNRRGSILIGVLWCVFFLSALAAAIYSQLAPQIGLAGRLKDRARSFYLAKGGVDKAIIVLDTDETKDYDALNDTWANNEKAFKDLQLGQQGHISVYYEVSDNDTSEKEIRYGLADEERRLNINSASFDVLKSLFELAGQTTSQTASDIADSILDWVDEDDEPRDNGAESGYYQALAGGYSCKNKKFQILEELLLVKGMTQEIFDKAGPYLTVYGSGKVNLNTAGKYVLEGLGMSDSLADKVIRFRKGNDGKEGTQDDNIFKSTSEAGADLNDTIGLSSEEAGQFNSVIVSGLSDIRSDYFRGESRGSWKYFDEEESGPTAKIVFIVDRNKNVRYWREQ